MTVNPRDLDEWAFLFAAAGMLPRSPSGADGEPSGDAMTVVWPDEGQDEDE